MKPGLWDAVVERDAHYMYGWYVSHQEWASPESFERWRERHPVICLVLVLEPTNRHPCSGPQSVDHVKKHAMMGRKAPDDVKHLVAMCLGHNMWWHPSKELREAERVYLGLR